MFFSEGQEYVEENYNDWSKLYTTLQLFEKNNAQGAFSCIISLHTKLYEREWPCTSDLLYNENNLIGRLYRYFYIYFKTFSAPAIDTLFLLVLSILAMESAASIRSLYRHFLPGITKKSLNAFYYACSYAKADYSIFMITTADMALNLIPEKLQSQPVFLCIDDTMVSKFGKKFEDISKLFDHAAHHDSIYLNGHCFVCVMLCVPVWNKGRIHYLSVPLGYHMWQKKESKLELAASMIRQVMPEFRNKKNVIILCGGWYVKKNLVSIVDEYENLDLIGNARSGSVIYGLPPQRTEKKGGAGPHRMGKGFLSRMILRCLMKKSGTMIWQYAMSLQIFLAKGKSLHM